MKMERGHNSEREVSHLKLHKESIDEKQWHSCDKCEFISADQASLGQHKKSKHEGVRYPCEQCGKTFARSRYLKTHKQLKHGANFSQPHIMQQPLTRVQTDEKESGRKKERSNEYENIVITPDLLYIKQEPSKILFI